MVCLYIIPQLNTFSRWRYTGIIVPPEKKEKWHLLSFEACKQKIISYDERPFWRSTKSVRPGRLLLMLCLQQTWASNSNTCELHTASTACYCLLLCAVSSANEGQAERYSAFLQRNGGFEKLWQSRGLHGRISCVFWYSHILSRPLWGSIRCEKCGGSSRAYSQWILVHQVSALNWLVNLSVCTICHLSFNAIFYPKHMFLFVYNKLRWPETFHLEFYKMKKMKIRISCTLIRRYQDLCCLDEGPKREVVCVWSRGGGGRINPIFKPKLKSHFPAFLGPRF